MSADSFFRYGVVCSLEPLSESKPVIFRGSIGLVAEEARMAGFQAMELHIRNPLDYDAHVLKKSASDNGLGFCALSTGLEYLENGLSLISDEARIRQAALQRLREHVDLAAQLDCLLVVGIMRANIPDAAHRSLYESYLDDALVSLAGYARERGVGLVFEAIMRYINNYYNTVPETVDYLRRLAQPNLKIHIDTHSMNVEDPDLPAAVRYCGSDLGYVHFSDSNRRFPGGGNIDFKPILQSLLDVRYTGYVTFECVPWPDAGSCARLCLEYIRSLETCIRIEAIR